MDTNSYNTRETLIQRAKNPNDHEAWEEFIHYYKRFIYYILRKMNVSVDDLDDLVQDILLALWRKLPDYERKNAKFRTWLGVVIKNTALNHLRGRKNSSEKHSPLLDSIDALSSLSESNLEADIEYEWKVYLGSIALEQLEKHVPGKALTAFTMGMKGVPSETIAEELDITLDSVYSLKNRVKKRLAKRITELVEKLEF